MSKNKKKDKKHKSKKNGASVLLEQTLDLRSVQLPAAPKAMKPGEVRALRDSFNASQALFARLLNVSSNAVESWEQGTRAPRQATLKLLSIAKKNPGVLLG